MKKVLFIDRDGTLVVEPPIDYQLDSLEKLTFYPGVFSNLSKIAQLLDYELVMVTNQDGLGHESFPEKTFWPAHNKILEALEGEGIEFDDVLIDRSYPEDELETRKPGTGLLRKYMKGNYDLSRSFVIGDRMTDMELAQNLGSNGILIGNASTGEIGNESIKLQTNSWVEIYDYLNRLDRGASYVRNTKETNISLTLDIDGTGIPEISTGIDFFDHMLDQLVRHSGIDLKLNVDGDLQVDEHHTIEDTAIAIGEAFRLALGKKVGIERYGFCLPMDDCLAQVAIDFGGRNWLEWDVKFEREMIGKMPTEMFQHFFKSFSDGACCNLNIRAEGANEHHKIEAIFKAMAKAIKMAVTKDSTKMILPTTKGIV